MTIEKSYLTLENVMEKVHEDLYNDVVQRKRKLYKPNHVFDENESVKWNREKLTVENKFIISFNSEIDKHKNDGQNIFYNDLRRAITCETRFNSKQAEAIYAKAWEEGHSEGYYAVVQYVDELVDFLDTLNELKD